MTFYSTPEGRSLSVYFRSMIKHLASRCHDVLAEDLVTSMCVVCEYFNASLIPWDTDEGRSMQLVTVDECFSGIFEDADTNSWLQKMRLRHEGNYIAMCIPNLPVDSQNTETVQNADDLV